MNKETKDYKKLCLLYGAASIACIIVAIMFYSKPGRIGIGSLWLILGCLNVCRAFETLKGHRNGAQNDDRRDE